MPSASPVARPPVSPAVHAAVRMTMDVAGLRPARERAIGAEALLLAVARRDRSAFAALFTAFAPRIKAYMMRVGMSGDVAEELAQETMIQIWRRAERFDPSLASAATWIFTI